MSIGTPDWLSDIAYNDAGLVPCIVQHATTSEVLMMAWMNQESIQKTLESGETWFYSRSRQELWHKGATSGNRQMVESLHLDCDGDTLLALVTTTGDAACHLGTRTCWESPSEAPSRSVGGSPRTIFSELIQVIADRDHHRPEDSYTTKLLEGGVDRAGKKVGEEATEVVIAAKNAIEGRGTEELAEESADLLYHLFVLWQAAQIDHDEIREALARRHS